MPLHKSCITHLMKRSTSTPSLVTHQQIPTIKRATLSCNSLPSLVEPESTYIFASKAPFTQVFTCTSTYTAPHVYNDSDSLKDLATCIATPHEPVDEEIIKASKNRNISYALQRYQIWYQRLVKRKRPSE